MFYWLGCWSSPRHNVNITWRNVTNVAAHNVRVPKRKVFKT
jgi:hypothetical protein